MKCVWEDSYLPASERISADNNKCNSKCEINIITFGVADVSEKTSLHVTFKLELFKRVKPRKQSKNTEHRGRREELIKWKHRGG